MLVDEDGIVTGIIDWDNVHIGPRQGAVMAYPSWITVDWDSTASPRRALQKSMPIMIPPLNLQSTGKYTSTQFILRLRASSQTLRVTATSGIVNCLSTFVFGSGLLGYEVEEGIRRGAWYALGKNPQTITEVAGVLYIMCLRSTIDG